MPVERYPYGSADGSEIRPYLFVPTSSLPFRPYLISMPRRRLTAISRNPPRLLGVIANDGTEGVTALR